MYAVIETGGKQYRVAKGDKLKVELLDATVGAEIALDKVLMIGGEGKAVLGKPFVTGGKVTATVLTHGKADKVHIIKFRRRKHYMKRQGHRQLFTQLQITDIVGA
jgi:large subunit ribosomal protein L21